MRALIRSLVLGFAAAVAVWLGACGGTREAESPAAAQEAYGHVHGLGVNPADEALFVATHTGLFRASKGETRLERVGRSRQDTMGFTVVAENTFLGSGHPEAREDKPPHLGLILSEDAGRSWRDLSLSGQADLHVIRVGTSLTYGVDAVSGSLLVSGDSAATWSVGQPPRPLFDLAVDPRDERHLIGATKGGLYRSRDRGASWRRIVSAPTGLLVWSRGRPRSLSIVGADGTVRDSRDAARSWRRVGTIGGEPTAAAAHAGDLYVATEAGSIKLSQDGGRSWSVRVRPPA